MDFSSDPWTWILPALAAGAILVWFVLGLISRGLDFYRAELEAERGARRDEHPRDEVLAELRSLDRRLAAIEHGRSSEVPRPRAVR